MELNIVNPAGALQNVTSYITQKTADGELIRDGSEEFSVGRANVAIAKGQALALVQATTTVPLSYKLMAVADDPRLYVGIAEHAAAAGGYVRACRQGVCELYVNAQTVAFGDAITVPGTNAGEASCSSTDPDATVIVGRVLGTVLGIKDANNLAPVKLGYV